MGLRKAIPGLARHEVETEPVRFDLAEVDRRMRETHALVSSLCHAGVIEWLQEHRPDVVGHLRDAETQVNEAVLAENAVDFSASIDRYVKRYRRAVEIYAEQPAVIERGE